MLFRSPRALTTARRSAATTRRRRRRRWMMSSSSRSATFNAVRDRPSESFSSRAMRRRSSSFDRESRCSNSCCRPFTCVRRHGAPVDLRLERVARELVALDVGGRAEPVLGLAARCGRRRHARSTRRCGTARPGLPRIGMQTRKREPRPGTQLTSTSPPCRLTRSRTRASPALGRIHAAIGPVTRGVRLADFGRVACQDFSPPRRAGLLWAARVRRTTTLEIEQ